MMRYDPLSLTVTDRLRIAEINTSLDKLTPRECDVLAGMLRGLTNKKLAVVLDISPRTVEVHRLKVLEKTQCRNAIELAWAVGCSQALEYLEDVDSTISLYTEDTLTSARR